MHRGGARATFTVRKCRSARASSASFRCIRRSSTRSMSFARRVSAARSCTSPQPQGQGGADEGTEATAAGVVRSRPSRSVGVGMVKVRAFRTLENSFRRMGFNHVAGVDEVGRGCLAGPVVAAAVVLNPDCSVPRVCDSKTATALERERLYLSITAPRSPGVWLPPSRRKSIPSTSTRRRSGRCSGRAHAGAFAGLRAGRCLPDSRSADGAAGRDPRRFALYGDRAASIIAKVTRDRMMQELHARDRYGFDKHKGYATRDHLDAVARFGYSDVHRRSFRPTTLFDRMEP